MTLQEQMAQSGFTPTQRALDADAYIASRNPQDHPDEFSFLGSMGYTYTGPARFYSSGTEYTTFLNSQASSTPFQNATEVAKAIDANPKIPTGEGIFAPIGSSQNTSTTNNGMLTGQSQNTATSTTTNTGTGAGANANNTSSQISRASVADINALYQKYLGRDARQSGLDYWRSTGEYADRGIQNLDDIEYNISISDEAIEYAQKQKQQQENTNVTINPATFTSSPPQGLTYNRPQLPSTAPAPSVKNVDYVKMLRGALADSLFKDLV